MPTSKATMTVSPLDTGIPLWCANDWALAISISGRLKSPLIYRVHTKYQIGNESLRRMRRHRPEIVLDKGEVRPRVG